MREWRALAVLVALLSTITAPCGFVPAADAVPILPRMPGTDHSFQLQEDQQPATRAADDEFARGKGSGGSSWSSSSLPPPPVLPQQQQQQPSPGGDVGGKSPPSRIPVVLDLPPVVLVPGIGGSIMVEPSTGLRVWIRLYEAEFYFKRFMWGTYNETTRTLDPLQGQPKVEPLLTGHGLDAIRNLDPSVHWPIYDYVSYFDSIIQVLENDGWIPGLSLFGVPWDWRQTMCWPPTLERLKDTILRAQRLNRGRKVKLISHSMGALVIKCFVSTYPEVAASSIDSWVSIAAPHKGASAKIYTELLQGYNLGNIVIDPACAKGVSMVAPSVYELLPFDMYAWKDPPAINFTLNGVQHSFTPSAGDAHYTIPIRLANVNYSVTLPSGGATPEPFCEACWELSQSSKRRIENAMLPKGVKYYNVIGISQPTPLHIVYGDVKRWEDLTTKKIKFVNSDGDGTVSVESAMEHGFGEWLAGELSVATDHMGLLMHKDVIVYVSRYVHDRL